jgi:tetratricopeptide (TPR) repeat protein
MSVGARSGAMGDSFSGLADEACVLFNNPGGLSLLSGGRLIAHSVDWVQSVSGGYFGFGAPIPKVGGFGFSFFYVGMEDLYRNIYGAPGGKFNNSDWVGTLGGSVLLSKRTSVGASFKVLQETLMDESASAFALDLGGMTRSKNGVFSLGIAVLNLGLTDLAVGSVAAPLPMTVRLGGAANFKGKDNRVVLTGEINDQLVNEILGFRGGVEYRMLMKDSSISFRGGYRMDGTSGLGGFAGLTMGVGFSIGNTDVDYALLPMGDMGMTHQFSLSMAYPGADIPAGVTGSAKTIAPTDELSKPLIEKNNREMSLEMVKQGDSFLEKGVAEEALVSYRRATELDPGVVEAWLKLGQLYESLKRDMEAYESYKKAYQLDPKNRDVLAWLKKWREAHPESVEGVALDNQKAMELYRKGEEQYKNGDHDGAIRSLLDSVQYDDSLWQAYQVLGNCYYRKAMKKDAMAAWERSLSIKPDNPELKTWIEKVR